MTYLQQVHSYRKSWFWLAVIFICGSLGANLVGVETTPVFVWGMFSKPEQPKGAVTIWQFEADGQPLDYTSWDISLFQRYFMTNPLDYAARMEALGVDPTLHFVESKLGKQPNVQAFVNSEADLQAFWPWLKRYTERAYGQKWDSLLVRQIRLRYDAHGKLQPDSVLQTKLMR
jgi:hypothetical protein